MRKLLVTVGAAAGCFMTTEAMAQSSVVIYGITDVGIVHVNNAGGHALTEELSGMRNGNRFGFLGNEDLGGGWQAIFQLENGFATNTGAFVDGTAASGSTPAVTRMFGDMAFVGLKSPWATVTMGRQYDFMYDMGNVAVSHYVGTYMHRPGTASILAGNNGSSPDFDRISGTRVDNAVKVTSKPVDGFTFGALYSFGGQPGEFSNGSTQSFGLNYSGGPLQANAAWTNLKEANGGSNYRVSGVGVGYQFGSVLVTGMYTNADWTATGAQVNTIEVGTQYRITPPLSVAIGYFCSLANHGEENQILKGTRNQVGFITDYLFSKSTDGYATVVYQRAQHGYSAQLYNLAPSDATTNHQTMVGVGLRHFF